MNATREATTLVAHTRRLAESTGDHLAYTWLEGDRVTRSLTFEALDARARTLAWHLRERGLAGERALLVFPPGLEFVCAFLGCLYAGVVAVPLSTPRNVAALEPLRRIARHAAPAVVLTDARLRELLASAAPLVPGLPVVDVEELETPDPSWIPDPVEPEALAFLQYTSGSTGAPKGVELSHANLMANERMIRAGFSHGPDTVFVGWLPLFHDMGLVGNVLQPLYLGVHSVLLSPAAFVQRPVRWLRAITRYGGTTSGSPNFGYELCAQRVRDEELEGLDLSTWRVAYNGSEPVRAATLERFSERFAAVGFRRDSFYPCYGMAEASLFVTGGRAREPFVTLDVDAEALEQDRVQPAPAGEASARRLVSCGRTWLDQRLLVVDPESREPLGEGRVGELWIRGANVARGYRRPVPEDSAELFEARLANGDGPWLRTGDLGFLSAGELYVTGRIKDLVIQMGRNVYPQDIELAAASSHEALRLDQAAAFTVEEQEQERLVVVAEVHRLHMRALAGTDEASTRLRRAVEGAVRAAVSDGLGLSVWRVALIRHGSLPRTTSGKVQRRRCRALWRAGELEEIAAQVPRPRCADALATREVVR